MAKAYVPPIASKVADNRLYQDNYDRVFGKPHAKLRKVLSEEDAAKLRKKAGNR